MTFPGDHCPALSVQCELWRADLPAEYVCLSHLYGNTHPEQITVSDQNLWNHLDVAREKYFGQTFWIDAVGINQADDDEKGHQVGLTGRIYTRA
jgi:Heterokaryon incompatibility protein (HET)